MINLEKGKGINLSKDNVSGEPKVVLAWKTGVDFDLHCVAKGTDSGEEHVYFGNKRGTFADLDQDAGVGNRAGNNKETMKLTNLKNLKKAVIYVEIYGKTNEDFSKYSGKLLIDFNGNLVQVEMKSNKKGKYFVIASIEDGVMVNINEVTSSRPTLAQFKAEELVTGVMDVTGAILETGAAIGTGIFRGVKNFFRR